MDWSEIDPSILGTLFERGLDPAKRSQLGAHYTDRDKIMQIIEPVVVRPWLREWERCRADFSLCLERADVARSRGAQTRLRGQAEQQLRGFLDRLRAFTVLDPACGSGNFLYLALHALKDVEHRVQLEAESMGLQRAFPAVGPANVKGIEINPYAAELARVSVWIGEIQWMRRNGFSGARDPILEPLETIECRDAILAADGGEPVWPEGGRGDRQSAFFGGQDAAGRFGRGVCGGVAEALQGADSWRGRPGVSLVRQGGAAGGRGEDCPRRSGGNELDPGRAQPRRTGPDCRAGRNLRCLGGRAVGGGWRRRFGFRWSVLGPRKLGCPRIWMAYMYLGINADLNAGAIDLTKAEVLPRNENVAFMGDTKNGSFDVPGDLAREWLYLPANPNGRPNSDVLKPWVNGRDLIQRSAGKWIVDFGWSISEEEAALYEIPFSNVAGKCEAGTPAEPKQEDSGVLVAS